LKEIKEERRGEKKNKEINIGGAKSKGVGSDRSF